MAEELTEYKGAATMEKLVSLAKRRGFVFQSSEIYGGQNGAWDYGPLGVELKNRIASNWWKEMTQLHDNIVTGRGDTHAPAGVGSVGTRGELH